MATKNQRDKRRSQRLEDKPLSFTGDVDIQASEGEGDSLPTVDMVLYTGEKVRLPNIPHPVVVNLDGINMTHKSRPILMDHDPKKAIGHTTSVRLEGQGKDRHVAVSGVISADVESDKELSRAIKMARNGFPWQSSIGAVGVGKPKYVSKGETIQANGRTFEGPLYYYRRTRLREASLVTLGADDNTSTVISASKQNYQGEIETMTFLEWLGDKGIEAEGLSSEVKAGYQKVYDLEMGGDSEVKGETDTEGRRAEIRDEDKELRASGSSGLDLNVEAGKYRYIAEIKAAAGGDEELLAEALDNELSAATVKIMKENKDLKAARADLTASGGFNSFNISVPTGESEMNQVELMEAGLSMSMGVTPEQLQNPFEGMSPERRRAIGGRPGGRFNVKGMKAEVIECAYQNYNQVGLQEAMLMLARKDGGLNRLTWGGGQDVLQASFTSLDLPNVFGPVVERKLISHYQHQPEEDWRKVVKTSSVRDFRRTTSGFKVYGTGHWEQLSGDGELKHGQMREAGGYTNKAESYGQINMVTRQDFINDDLGVLNAIAENMALYAGMLPHIEAIKTIAALQADNYISAGRGNLLTGANTALDFASLEDLYETFKYQQDSEFQVPKDAGKAVPRLAITPRYLLVPFELELTAERILTTPNLVQHIGGGNTDPGEVDYLEKKNLMAGKFELIKSHYLGDSAVCGANASSTAYYLFADPNFVPAVEIVYLNGVQRPTIETVEPRPEILGMGFRGWFDFGVEGQDGLGVAKATGA